MAHRQKRRSVVATSANMAEGIWKITSEYLCLSPTPYAGRLPVQARPSWFGLKQQECVDPGLASLLESIVWPECKNEFEVLR